MTDKLAVGSPCQFYHSGGHGERRWVVGWRFGLIRYIPIKGQKKGQVQIEVPVPVFGPDERGKQVRKPNLRVWVSELDVNEVGDTQYHGPKAAAIVEMYEERQEQKKKEQAKVDKKIKVRRFSR